MAEQQISFGPVILKATGTPFANLPTKQNPPSQAQAQALFELLLVGGGGGGSEYAGAGGGGGGLVYDTAFPITASSTYAIVVGSGGAAGPDGVNDSSGSGANGASSTISEDGTLVYTAVGGGGGGGVIAAGRSGGSSGGDGRYSDNSTRVASTQTLYDGKGFGNAGGLSGKQVDFNNRTAGGGGGAGGIGGDGTSTVGGSGGDGKVVSITGSEVYYSAGGPGKGYSSTSGSYGAGGSTTPGGGGRGGEWAGSRLAEAGNDGIVILASTVPAQNITGTYTLDAETRPGYYVYTFTSNGTISFAEGSTSGSSGGDNGGTGDNGGSTPAGSLGDVTFATDSFLSSSGANEFSYFRNNITNSTGVSKSNPLPGDGKYYFEVDVSALTVAAVMFGLGPDDFSGGYDTSGGRFIYPILSRTYPGGSNYPNVEFSAGDTVMIAYDGNTREVWFGTNGVWGEDPANTSSYTIGGSSGDGVAILFGSGTYSALTFTGTVVSGSNLTYTAPTGFQS